MKSNLPIYATLLFLWIFSSYGIAQTNKPIATKKINFTIKKYENLPEWWNAVERTYMLNDDRTTEDVKYIGGFNPKMGEMFFIDSKIIIFNENQIKVSNIKDLYKKTFSSGDYQIIITWDDSERTGAYLDGKISLYFKNILQFNSTFVQSGF